MHKLFKKTISAILCAGMILSLMPDSFAYKSDNGGRSYFDFEASEYEVGENDGELKIKIVRHGEGNSEADVAFKAADFISSYGDDYEILDEDGNVLDKIYGEKPSLSDIEYDGDGSGISDLIGTENETADEIGEAEIENSAEDENTAEETVYDETVSEQTEETEDAVEEAVSENTYRKSTGSKLRDARAAYLNITDNEDNAEKETAVKETLDDMYNYFMSAEGAAGIVHFNTGDTEKTITIKIIDNDAAEQNKIFMVALMGTDNDETMTAANATTYVTIVDDEPVEKAYFDIGSDDIVLTEDSPEGYVTVTRTGGTQYFATVYVSTVTDTADKNTYENFEYKPVAFVPGETEKQIKVKANGFEKSGRFGIRLEGETNVEIGNYYTEVNIAADGENASEIENTDDTAELFANAKKLGSESWNAGINIPGGWKTDITGDGKAWIENGDMNIKQYDKNKYTMYVSKDKLNLVGNKSITYNLYVTNVSRGFNTKYKSYDTFFETDSDQTFDGSLNSIKVRGNSNWTERTLSLDNSGKSAYLKFSTKPTSSGYDNPKAVLDWVKFNYAYYAFNTQNSVENFNRKVYDFTQGVPNVYDSYYDGEKERVYNPGGIVIKNGNETVDGFYANNTASITITAAEESKNKGRGIYLKGVYFVKNSIADHSLYSSGKYTSENVYYVAASNGKVTVTPNQSFIETLYDKGVVSGVHSDEKIKVYPVFAQEYVQVNFENADRDDTKAATKGKFDKKNKASYIINILEACDKGNVTKKVYDKWLDYYTMKVPKYSVIRVKTQPVSTRVANGVAWWSFDGKRSGTTYHKSGDMILSGTMSAGEKIKETDYTTADILVTEGIAIKPLTGTQTFDISYYPKQDVPENYQGENGLTNAVILSDDIAKSDENTIGTDKKGGYTFEKPYIGMNWSLMAIAPEGYYTQWVNMTGDTDNDGYIDETEAAAIRTKSATMPDEVYGNKLSGKLDQDNFKLYYYFLPKTTSANGKKTGTVVRSPETFYQLVNNIKSSAGDIPVSAAYVDIGGFIGQTDANGNYSILCNDLPSAGNVSTTVTADGYSYNTVSKLQKNTDIKLDALSKFKAKSLDVYYANTTGAIADDFITVNDDNLTVKAVVTSDSAIVPADARFFIYDNNGNEKMALDGAAGYTTRTESSGNELTAYLTFNPKKDMQFGYKLYAQFADQNGEWSNAIDLGYYFTAKLSLAEFIFPLIGSSSLEDTIRTGFVADIIGDPLGDMSLGSISGFEETSYTHTPSGINKKDAPAYTWQYTDYTFGWSKEFGGSKDTSSAERDEEKLKNYLKSIYDGTSKGAAPPAASKFATKSSFKWSLTPSVGFNLTLSSRRDGKTYFEDLVFYVKVEFDVGASQTIQLPVGISILIEANLDGDIAGIYHMYVDYQDSYETEDAVEYTAEDFGLFKKFNNSVRREGYIFLDPSVSVKLGVGYGVVYVTGSAKFDFDMDFQFTESGTNTYGDVTIDLSWGIELFNFTVYSKSLYNTTAKMFNSKGTDGHIDFDYGNENTISTLSVADYFTADGDEKLQLDTPTSREYLNNRSDWLGEEANADLFTVDAAEGTKEQVLKTGVPENTYADMVEFGDGKILTVFVDDDITRTDKNKRAVYYTIYSDSVWSKPVQIDADGTLDDYPSLCDLGDGRIFITWSSADKVLSDDATVEDALKAMNIKAAFFDTATQSVGDVMQITKTTAEDYSADTMPNAAYDSDTGRLILYYTKTEYSDLDSLDDISKAYSANAYMLYENGRWSNADDYFDDELAGMTESEKEEYRTNWYGQRFINIDIDNDKHIVTDTTAITYNGLALFAWTLDWDANLDTINDRDIFMQIYNFAENSFTHIIRVTAETAAYTTPKFVRSDNATYLFYGETAQESGTELEEHGSVKYLNISDLIKGGKFTKINDGGNKYYIFQYEREEYSYDAAAGSTEGTPSEKVTTETVIAQPSFAVQCDNPMDYDVKVGKDGQMYLFWTEVYNGARQIVAAVYNGSDENDDDETTGENKQDADLTEEFWSDTVVLTDAGENEHYSGIGAVMSGGKIYAVGAKGNYNDNTATAFVFEEHTPFAKVKAVDLSIDSEMPQSNSTISLTAVVKNEGLKTQYASEEEPIAVTFELIGGEKTVKNITKPIPGGMSTSIVCDMTLPDDISNVEFAAYIDKEDSVTAKVEQKNELELSDNSILRTTSDGYNDEKVLYSAVLENVGNVDVSNVVLTAKIDENEVGEFTLDEIASNEMHNIEMELDIPDSAYTIDESGIGSAEIEVTAVLNNEAAASYSGKVEKVFSKYAIDELAKVTEIVFEDDAKYSMKVGEKKEIQPAIEGSDENALTVLWLESSDTEVANVNYDNVIVANSKGKATFTGIVVPANEQIEFTTGEAKNTDWRTLIPSDSQITVTMTVTVNNSSSSGSSGSSGGGGGRGRSSTKYKVVFVDENGNEIESVSVSKNGTVSKLATPDKDGYAFDGWYTDEEFTKPFTTETKVISDTKVYAKWTEKPESTDDKNNPVKDDENDEMPFKDINDNDWYFDAVKYAYANKLFAGVSDDEFAPNNPLTRAMLVTVLWRVENMPESEDDLLFEDVQKGQYYYDAICWAAKEGIVNGIAENMFAPDEYITREQMAAIMFRYANYKGYDVSVGEDTNILSYTDFNEISEYAISAMQYAVGIGLIEGRTESTLNPQDNTTRAETAVIMQRFMENLKEAE